MKKKKNIVIIIILLIILALVVILLVRRNSNKATYELETTTIRKNDISVMVTATGTVEPITQVEVGTQVSGIIDKIYVDYNSEVTRGQILAELDKETLSSDYRSKENELKSARTEYEYQEINYNRFADLYERELISRSDFETAKYNFDRAEASYNKLISDLEKVRTNLGYATITSPIDGVVLSRAVEEGQTVAASFNTPTLFTIANDLTKMQVVANVDEADIGEVREGQRVTFTVDAYPADIFEGTTTQVRLEPIITSNVVTYEVLVNAPNPDLKLKPGLTANISIYTTEQRDVNSLPNRALSFIPDEEILTEMGYTISPRSGNSQQLNERTVWLVQDFTLNPRMVEVGETDGINTEIISGLSSNDNVATSISLTSEIKTKSSNGTQSPLVPQGPGRRR